MQEIYKKLAFFKNLFDPSKETYREIYYLSNSNLTKNELINILQKINERENFNGTVKEYYDYIMKELASIKDETIQNYQAENKKLSNDIIDNLKERDVTIKQEQQKENQTPEEVKTENDALHKIKESLVKEKEVGQKFGKEFEIETKTFNKNLQEVNEKASQNIKHIINPSNEDMTRYINFYKDNIKEGYNYNIKIKKELQNPNQRTVEIYYNGINVSEKEPKLIINFTDAYEFEKSSMYHIIMEYAKDETTDYNNKLGNNLTNVSKSGNTISFENVDVETSIKANSFIEKVQDNTNKEEKEIIKEQEKENVRVRKNEEASVNLMVVILCLIVLVCAIYIYVNFFS